MTRAPVRPASSTKLHMAARVEQSAGSTVAIKASVSCIVHVLTWTPGPGYPDRGGGVVREPGRPPGPAASSTATAPLPLRPGSQTTNKRGRSCCCQLRRVDSLPMRAVASRMRLTSQPVRVAGCLARVTWVYFPGSPDVLASLTGGGTGARDGVISAHEPAVAGLHPSRAPPDRRDLGPIAPPRTSTRLASASRAGMGAGSAGLLGTPGRSHH